MISREEVREILEYGVRAPSGENCQPWKFISRGDKIEIFNIPEKDSSLYNFRQRGSFIAHGALIENICIAASARGYRASVMLFPDGTQSGHITSVLFEKTRSSQEESLCGFIKERATNRKPYLADPLSASQKSALLASAGEVGDGEVKLVETREDIRKLAIALACSDRILFENRELHDFLFNHISWNREDAERKKFGFYIEELELNPVGERAFKIFKNWGILRFLNKLGLSKAVANQNIKLYSACAAIGAILIRDTLPERFVAAGRLMERIWLKATQMGLSIQPITGIAFFIQRVFVQENKEFSPDHIELIEKAYRSITEVFCPEGKVFAMIFRIGYGGKPTAKSLRLPPEVVFSDT